MTECILGTVTEKAAAFIKQSAEAAAKGQAESSEGSGKVVLQKHRWVPVTLVDHKAISDDTRAYTFQLPDDKPDLGLGTCQHFELGFQLQDRLLIRSYTRTKPLLPDSNNDGSNHTRDGSVYSLWCRTWSLGAANCLWAHLPS